MKTVIFEKWNKKFELEVKFEEYANGGTAITLTEVDDYEPFMTASVWIEGLNNDEIAIKDYSENEGILAALIAAGIIEEPHRKEAQGWVMIPICKLCKN